MMAYQKKAEQMVSRKRMNHHMIRKGYKRMMNRKEFYEYVKDNVKEYLPESYRDAEIKLQEVEKNNGLKLTGITIPNGDQRIVPRVYLIPSTWNISMEKMWILVLAM